MKFKRLKFKNKKMKAHKFLAGPVYSYGSEAWTNRKQDERRLTSEEITFLKQMTKFM